MKKNIPSTYLIFLALFAFSGLGWIFAAFLFGRLAVNDVHQVLSSIGYELGKTIFIGSTVGIFISSYLKRILQGSRITSLETLGIQNIYKTRSDAAPKFLEIVKNSKNKRIDIIGISLREFLTGGGALNDVWRYICDRLESEEQSHISPDRRLSVRILLLDHRSSEGYFRHNIEKDALGAAGLPIDIPQSFEAILNFKKRLYGDKNQNFLQIRLYQHCPFSFIFATEHEIFVEQYSYRNYAKGFLPSVLPVIQYDSDSIECKEVTFSYNTIWENTTIDRLSNYDVGTAYAIEEGKISNIYRYDRRSQLSGNEIENIIGSNRSDHTIDILAVSGKFYTSNALNYIRQKARDKMAVRIALVNPVSEQAILRAVADSFPAENVKRELSNWTWDKHIRCRLYRDIQNSIDAISDSINQGYAISLHLYFCSISCALLLTRDSAFIEQYLYGRSRGYQEGLLLGREYPVIEYDISETGQRTDKDNIEKEILINTFNLIWNAYSIDIKYYDREDEKSIFEENLKRILANFKKQELEAVSSNGINNNSEAVPAMN